MTDSRTMRVQLLILTAVVGAACHHGSGLARTAAVFSDFRYVGRQALSADFVPGFEPAPVEPAREALHPGYRYVFHRRLPSDNVRLATETLPARLKKAGIRITEHPERFTDMKDTFAGGPLFVIRFQVDGHTCRLFNAVDPLIARSDELGRDWAPDDYVLEISR